MTARLYDEETVHSNGERDADKRSINLHAKVEHPLQVAFALACTLAAACSRGRSSEPEPPSSGNVITLGAAIGTCSDIVTCERECDAGSADRCRRLAASFALGQGVQQDEGRATLLYVRACEMGDPSACVFAGQMNEFARGVPKDEARAARFYERACDLRWAPGCYNLAIMYERGAGVAENRQKASELYQIACTAGATSACDKARAIHGAAAIPLVDGDLQ